jgi:hypothetical protein
MSTIEATGVPSELKQLDTVSVTFEINSDIDSAMMTSSRAMLCDYKTKQNKQSQVVPHTMMITCTLCVYM